MNKELPSGTNLSHYRIVSKIGAGGMGEVYLAEDTKLERRVALKVLIEEVANDPDRVSRFVREAKAASALNHPNILTVFEIGSVDDTQYIATEFIKGETLRELMGAGEIGLNEALGIALQVAAALGAAHEAGIVHRDIKPENIMIREDGLVKVLDFGLAKLTEKSIEAASSEDATKVQFNTQPGMIMGTAAYMSPEQARGRELDPRTDIFSLGIVMYELFTGRRPFEGEGQVDLISSILKDDPVALRQLSPNCPRHLERIVDKALRKDRENRYQHVKDLAIDLEDLREELKFEAKLNKTTDLPLPAQITNAGDVRTTLTESISATRRFTLLHALIFILVTGGLFAAVWLYRSAGSTLPIVPGSLKVVEVANWNSAPGEIYSNARFSPDGKMIAFASTRSGSKNIWVKQTTSPDALQITNDANSNTDPIWSPKGDEVAFISQKGDATSDRANKTGVWRISALGSGTPKSVGPIEDGSSVLRRWTESGRIYFQSNGNLFSMDMASGTSQKLTTLEREGGTVSWVNISADEKTIAYVVKAESGWQFFVSDVANKSPKKIADGTGVAEGFVWLPERGRLFYGEQADGVIQIFVRDSGSSTPIKLTASETDSVVVDAAGDGTSIIFSSAKEESNLWRVDVLDSQESPVLRDLNSKLWPSISPDGERIVFQSVKNMSRGNNLFSSSILVKPLKSGQTADNPTSIAENGMLPVWSPDGSTIAFVRKIGNVYELVSVSPNGGSEKVLASGGMAGISYSVSPYNVVQTGAFAWNPDSVRIAYAAVRDGVSNLFVVNRKDGTEESLTQNADPQLSMSSPSWSPDGNTVAVVTQKKSNEPGKNPVSGISIIDVNTKAQNGIYLSDGALRLLGWSADKNAVIIAETESRYRFSGLPPEIAITSIVAGSGRTNVIARLKNAYAYNIFLSSDRRSIAFAARNEERDDLWVLQSDGGEPRRLTRNNDSGVYISRLAWLNDGNSIIFGKQTRFSVLSMVNDIR
ncbi:MAG: serine/threonine-protein kinase [Pyrinomonadaceae bacterium]|nr:serine/threonine-protein kinase [Pyrinomonadaceae bacterium]MBP6212540.1 serine/threonine-protein kinase [Pyrinomonadaceae bacterium]